MPFDGFETHVVYRLYPDRPGWLDVDEAAELRELLKILLGRAGTSTARPPRATRSRRSDGRRYLEYGTPWVVGAFESLIKIGPSHLTAQFSQGRVR